MGYPISNKTILIFVPHEDDEINLAGKLIISALEHNCKVTCCFMTNGDYNNSGEVRIREAIKSLQILGLSEKNIIFLGYCDQGYNSNDHVYYHMDDCNYISNRGYTETYGTANHPEWCLQKGGHKKLNHNNILKDIEEVILTYRADYCVCSDFDAHPDHRALSLLFEEAVSNVLHTLNDYHPIVLKGFTYSTEFYAPKDFRIYNQLSVVKPEAIDENLQLDNPAYDWNDRLRIPITSAAQNTLLLNNPIFKALLAHKTQKIAQIALSVINSDCVYWARLTTSVTYQCKFIASSGDSKFLHDFRLFDSSNILEEHNNIKIYDDGYWIPSSEDEEKSFYVYFKKSISLYRILLYENPSPKNHILLAKIELSNGFCTSINNINEDGRKTLIELPVQKGITWLKFRIEQAYGDKAGLGEFEVYEPYTDEINFVKICIDDNFAYRWYLSEQVFEFRVEAFTNNGVPILLNPNKYIVEFSSGIQADKINCFKGKLIGSKGTIKVQVEGTDLKDQVELIALKWPVLIKFLFFQIINSATILFFQVLYKIQRILK